LPIIKFKLKKKYYNKRSLMAFRKILKYYIQALQHVGTNDVHFYQPLLQNTNSMI